MRFPLHFSRHLQRWSSWILWGKKQTYRKSKTSTTKAFPPHLVCFGREVSQKAEMGLSGSAPSHRRGCKRLGECVCLRVRLCVCPAKYFLHYTANPISSFRKLCNVNSRAPFIEQLGPCLPRTPILLTANKMHTEELSLPEECALASLALWPCCCHFLWQLLWQGNGSV